MIDLTKRKYFINRLNFSFAETKVYLGEMTTKYDWRYPLFSNINQLHRVHPMCNIFFEQFVFCPVSPLCKSQKNFQLKNDKNERKWIKHGFQSDKIEL